MTNVISISFLLPSTTRWPLTHPYGSCVTSSLVRRLYGFKSTLMAHLIIVSQMFALITYDNSEEFFSKAELSLFKCTILDSRRIASHLSFLVALCCLLHFGARLEFPGITCHHFIDRFIDHNRFPTHQMWWGYYPWTWVEHFHLVYGFRYAKQ